MGMLVYVEGELRTRVWDDESGVRRYRTEVKIDDMKLLDSKDKQGIGIEGAKKAAEDRNNGNNKKSEDKDQEKVEDKDEEKVEEKEEKNEDKKDKKDKESNEKEEKLMIYSKI